MATEVFIGDVDGHAYRDGKELYAAETIKPGLLCTVTGGSGVSLADNDSTIWGVAYGARHNVWRPTSRSFAEDEAMVLLKGNFSCYYSEEFFSGDTLPSAGDTIYAGDSGVMATTGTVTVGRCERTFSRIEEVAGVGASQDLVEIRFDLT